MIKICYIGQQRGIPFVPPPYRSQDKADRYYFRYHSKEVMRVYSPWQRRYAIFRTYEPPEEAVKFNASTGRGWYVEIWFESLEAYAEADKMPKAYTPPPGKGGFRGGIAITVVPAVPSEVFIGPGPTPEERPIMRWIRAFKYPDGVSLEDGDKWYLNTHSQELKKQTGLLRYTSHLVAGNPPGKVPWLWPQPYWHRLSEFWYEDFSAWRKAVIESPPRLTPPPWGSNEPFVEMASVFVALKPTIDFIRDDPMIP